MEGIIKKPNILIYEKNPQFRIFFLELLQQCKTKNCEPLIVEAESIRELGEIFCLLKKIDILVLSVDEIDEAEHFLYFRRLRFLEIKIVVVLSADREKIRDFVSQYSIPNVEGLVKLEKVDVAELKRLLQKGIA